MAQNIPVHLIETINKLVRVSRRLLLDLGRESTPEEIAERLAMPVEKVRGYWRLPMPDRPDVMARLVRPRVQAWKSLVR